MHKKNHLEKLADMRSNARAMTPERLPPNPASGATQVYLGTRSSRPTTPVRRMAK